MENTSKYAIFMLLGVCLIFDPPGGRCSAVLSNKLYTRKERSTETNTDKCVSPVVKRNTEEIIADRDEIPWLALVGYEESESDSYQSIVCGGTLISENQVLTHNDCVDWKNTTYYVRLGQYIYDSGKHCDEDGCRYPVQDISRTNPYNIPDGVVLTLSKPAELSEYVKPLCIKESEKQEGARKNVSIIIHGWGTSTRREDKYALVKMAVVVQLKEGSECESADIFLDPSELAPCLKEEDSKFLGFSEFEYVKPLCIKESEKQEGARKNVSIIIHGWGTSTRREDKYALVKMAVVVQLKEGSECESADIFLDPSELAPCLKEEDSKFLGFSEFGAAATVIPDKPNKI